MIDHFNKLFLNEISSFYSILNIINVNIKFLVNIFLLFRTQNRSDLARLVRLWRALIDERLKPLDLTQSHWVTLYNINRLPPKQSQIQLAKAIGIEQPSLVRTLDQLEEKGLILIIRHICSNDRRAKRIQLTNESTPIIKKVEDVIRETRKDILEGIPQTEIKLLSDLIEKIEKNIKELQGIKNNTHA